MCIEEGRGNADIVFEDLAFHLRRVMVFTSHAIKMSGFKYYSPCILLFWVCMCSIILEAEVPPPEVTGSPLAISFIIEIFVF